MSYDRNRRPQYGRYANDGRGNYRGNGGGFRGRGGGYRDRDGGGYEQRPPRDEAVYSEKVRAGKRRTYFFDVRQTRGEDYFITITESTRRNDGYGHTRHKIFLYKEDFNRFSKALEAVINKVKTDLMPDFDYEEFDRRQAEWESNNLDEEGNYIGPKREEGDAPQAEAETTEEEATEVAEEEASAEDETKIDPELKGEDDMEW